QRQREHHRSNEAHERKDQPSRSEIASHEELARHRKSLKGIKTSTFRTHIDAMHRNRNSDSAQHPPRKTLKGNQTGPRTARSARLPLRVFRIEPPATVRQNNSRRGCASA